MTTALALDHFARRNVDVAVIETGLGGRLDATNVLKPELTVTTSISRDHTEILGDTLTKIAREKAGIIKPKVPHLVGPLPKTAERVMRAVCRRQKSPYLSTAQPSAQITVKDTKFEFRGESLTVDNLRLSLPGEHQLVNAMIVLRAVDLLNRNGLSFTPGSVRRGLRKTDWAGRFEVVREKGRPTFVFDVCHNAAGAESFAATFAREFPGLRTHVIIGLVKRKEHQKIVNALAKIAASFSLVPMKTHRSMDLDELLTGLNWRGVPVRRFGSLHTARKHLLKSAAPDDIISVIGSHYLVGEYLKRYR